MAAAGVPRDHIAKVDHVEGRPIAMRVDDRYAHDAEKREALECWTRGLQSIIDGKTSKLVVVMRSR